jgi:myo-inositol-1(or 4)-monophosphatase
MSRQDGEYQALRALAETLARQAGEYVLQTQAQAAVTQQKDALDIATTTDLGSEKIIIEGIRKKFPDHSIYSEEAGESAHAKSKYRWIIDPLDGTKEYVRGIPQFNVSIAVEYEGVLVVAAIYRPTDQTLYSASLGEGAFRNGSKITVSNVDTLSKSFVYCYLPSYQRNAEDYTDSWDKLGSIGKQCYRLRSFADENTALCWLAQGGHEAYINLNNPPKWHDIAPGLFIALQAGAYIPSKLIEAIKKQEKCSIIVANNATIWQAISNLSKE